MAKIQQPQKESLTIRLGTKGAEADAAAVASTMQAVAAIVEETQIQLKTTEHVLLKARPFAKGSFEIPLDLILVGAATLFENHPLLSSILDILKEYLKVRQLLKGQALPPPERDGTFIVNGSSITIQNSVINIVSNGRVQNAVDKAATDLLKDETIKDVKFFRDDDSTPMAVIPQSEFEYLKNTPTTESLEEGKRNRVVTAMLTLRSPVFDGRSKWKFNYEGAKIDASIADEDFRRKVQSGLEQFAAGDRLEVTLNIKEEYNQQFADYERKGFSVTQVLKHIKRPLDVAARQMFDDDES